ncbi:hypothetical protein U9M48_035497 [Paspalum notatum var. saurae]|uniref:Uncharacterized protein n=1 Tax=Paspalum notatum var. saurae TaxID=547442 RepID=A0AAQ3X7R0_PASNO
MHFKFMMYLDAANTATRGTAAPKMDRGTSDSSTIMASATGLVLNQVGTHDPTYLSLIKGWKVYTRPPHPRAARKKQGKQAAPEDEEMDREPPPVKKAPKSAPHEFYDSTVLPFPQRQKKASVDDQFGKFVEVPTYANCHQPKLCTSRRSVAPLYSTSRLKRRRILGTPPYHAQSEPRILIKLSVIWEQALASCQR